MTVDAFRGARDVKDKRRAKEANEVPEKDLGGYERDSRVCPQIGWSKD